MLLTWSQSSGLNSGNPRTRLSSILSDGFTVADYDASLGVTGALNASAWANQNGIAGPLLQATGAAQPIILPFSGQKYAYLPGVVGNYLSTPSASVNRITGDLDLRVFVAMDNWQPTGAGYQTYVSKRGAVLEYYLTVIPSGVGTAGKIRLNWTQSAVIKTADSTVANIFTAGQSGWIRATLKVNNGSSGYDVNFYTSADGVSWAQLGATVTGGAPTSLDTSNNTVFLGSYGGGSDVLFGKLYRAQIYNGINGTLAVDYNAADWPETSTNGATQASSTTGEVWTLNNTAISKPAMIVGTSMIGFDGAAQFMAATYATTQQITTYDVEMIPMWTNGNVISDGVSAGTMRIKKSGLTPAITLDAGTEVASNTGDTLRAWHVRTTVLNGASSSIQIDSNAATTGNAGAGNPGGWTMGADGAGLNFGSKWGKRSIMRLGADSAATQAQINALLRQIYSTP